MKKQSPVFYFISSLLALATNITNFMSGASNASNLRMGSGIFNFIGNSISTVFGWYELKHVRAASAGVEIDASETEKRLAADHRLRNNATYIPRLIGSALMVCAGHDTNRVTEELAGMVYFGINCARLSKNDNSFLYTGPVLMVPAGFLIHSGMQNNDMWQMTNGILNLTYAVTSMFASNEPTKSWQERISQQQNKGIENERI